jgi:hypothetical protein
VNIEPLACSNAEATALAGCIERDSVVLTQRLARLIDKEAWFFGLGKFLLDKRTVVSLSDKADLLTFFQLVGREPQGFGLSPYVRFWQAAKREEKIGEPERVEAIEKIGLILALIGGSCQNPSALMVLETSIVACRHVRDVSGGCEIDEAPELHSLVTADTGVGCRTGRIALEKIINHSFPKAVAGIDDFVRDVEKFGDMLDDADLATAPFLPLFGWRDAVVLVFPHLEGNAVHFVALADEQ